jgi:hypothetical protein
LQYQSVQLYCCNTFDENIDLLVLYFLLFQSGRGKKMNILLSIAIHILYLRVHLKKK